MATENLCETYGIPKENFKQNHSPRMSQTRKEKKRKKSPRQDLKTQNGPKPNFEGKQTRRSERKVKYKLHKGNKNKYPQ